MALQRADKHASLIDACNAGTSYNCLEYDKEHNLLQCNGFEIGLIREYVSYVLK